MSMFEGKTSVTPAQSGDLPLQHGHISIGVLIDHSLVSDMLGSAGKLQSAERFLSAHQAWTDVGNDHGLSVAAQRVLHHAIVLVYWLYASFCSGKLQFHGQKDLSFLLHASSVILGPVPVISSKRLMLFTGYVLAFTPCQ